MEDLSLEKLDAVRLAIEHAATVQEIKSTLDTAHAAEVYAKQARLGKDIQDKAWQYINRAERKLGEMLQAAKAAGQISKTNTLHRDHVPDGNMMHFTLKEAGIDRKLSMRAQQKAKMPEEKFEQMLKEGKRPKVNSNKIKKEPPKAHYCATEVMAHYDAGDSNREIAEATGLNMCIVKDIVREERLRREPVVSRDDLSLTAQQKFDTAIKQEKARLAVSFATTVDKRVQEFLSGSIGPILEKEQKEAKWIMESRKGVMTRKQFNQIRACLHADRTPSDEEKHNAFVLFTSFEKFMLKEKECPTSFTRIPTNWDEWVDARRKGNNEQKRKRAEHGGDLNVVDRTI